MLSTTTTNTSANSDSWKADFLRVSTGLRGLLIIWVTVGHLNPTLLNSQFTQVFNTAAFIMLSGFSTCLQTRSTKLNYGSWIVSKWFGLIPISILNLLMWVPTMQKANGTHVVSVGTQVYMWVTTFLGFEWLGVAGNFGFVHNATAFDTDSNFGDVGAYLSMAMTGPYFATFLFTSMVFYVPIHFVLSYKLPRKILQSMYGLVPAVLSVGLMWAASFISLDPNLLEALKANHTDGFFFAGFFLFLMPLFPAGVFLAEMRCQLPHSVKAVLGHWVVVDLSVVGFFVYSFMASGRNCISIFCPATLFNQFAYTVQPALFGLMLLALSCQSYHKKRSLIVFIFFERDTLFLPSVFGKYCYTFYLFQLPLISGVWMQTLVCLGDSQCSALPPGSDPNASTSYKVLTFVLSLVLAVLAQWVQDTYITAAHMQFMQLLNCDGACWALFTHEQNPLSGLVLMCWPAEQMATEEALEAGQKNTAAAIRG